jgi:hypothetical protein
MDFSDEHADAAGEQPEQQPPRSKRTSVVDMWRKRETAVTEPVATATAASPGRRKSVLEKWSSAQQKQAAALKVTAGEEKKEQDGGPLSVAEMIAKRSNATAAAPPKATPIVKKTPAPPQQQMSIVDMMKARNATLQQAAAEPPAPEQEPSKPQMSIGDMMKARNAVMGGVSASATPTPVATAPAVKQQLETDLVIVGSNDDADDEGRVFQGKKKATPLKKTDSIANKWNQRGLASIDAISTTPLPEPQGGYDADDLHDHPTPQRQSVADIWSKRVTSSPVLIQGNSSRGSSAQKPSPRPVIPEEASVTSVGEQPEPATKRWDSLRSPAPLSSTTHISQELPSVDSKPAWATKSLNRSMEPKASDDRSATGSETSSNGKPAWANRSVPPGTPEQPKSSHVGSGSSSKPAWASRSLKKPSSASSPAAAPDSSASKPAWASKSLMNRTPFSSPEPKKAADSRPSWAAQSSPVVAISSPTPPDETNTAPSVVEDDHVDDAVSVASSKQEEQQRATVETLAPRPKWAGQSKAQTNFSSPAPPLDSKPAWMKRSLKSASPSLPKPPTDPDSKPAWARKSLSSPAVAPSPTKSIESSNKPAWARRSFSSPVGSIASRSLPSPSAKPAWATASLRKTGRAIGRSERKPKDEEDDLVTIQSEQPPAIPALPSKKGYNSIDDSEMEDRRNVTDSWQKKVNRREISQTKSRNPNKKKIAIEMSTKDAVDAANAQSEAKPLSPARNTRRSVAEELLESSVPEPLSPPREFGKSPKLSPALDWPSAAGDDDALDQAHEDAALSQTSVLRKQDSVRTPRSSVGRSSPRSSVGGASPSRSLAGLTSRSGSALWWNTPSPHDAKGKQTIESKRSIKSFDAEVADINDNNFEGPSPKPKHAPPKSPLVIELANQYRVPARGSVFRTNSPAKGRGVPEKTNPGSNQQLGARSMSSLSKSEVKKTATPTRFSKRRFQIAQNHLGAKPSLSTVPWDEADVAKKEQYAAKMQAPQKYEMNDVGSPRSIRSSDSRSVGSAPNTPSSSRLGRAESKKEIQKRRFRMKNKRDLDGDDHSVASTSSWISDSRSVGYSKPSTRVTSTEVPVTQAPPVTVSGKVNLPYESVPTGFMDSVDELVTESPKQSSSSNINGSRPAGLSKVETRKPKVKSSKAVTSGFDEEFSRLAIAGNKPARPVGLKDDALRVQTSPLSSKKGISAGAFSPYLPDNLSPRTLNPNASSRVRHKKELELRKSRTPSGSNAGSATASDLGASDWTFFSTNRPSSPTDSNSVVSSASGSSTLADRASRVIRRRRGRRVSSKNTSPARAVQPGPSPKVAAARAIVERKKRQAVPLSPTYSAVFDDSFMNQPVPIQQPSPSVPTETTKPKFAIKRSQKERPAVDRSGFVNRYKSSERFIDAGIDTPHGLTPLQGEPTPAAYSFGSEVSERSSPQQSARSSPQPSVASSEGGSRLYLEHRTDTLASESSAEPLGIDKNFRNESSSNIYAMRAAYKSVTVSDMAKDLQEEVAATFTTFTGSVSAMKNFASEFGRLTTSPSKKCDKALGIPGQSRAVQQEEEVAIEVEYIGDDEYPADEDFFDQRAMQKANRDSFDLSPAGQSSYEGKV